MSPITAALATGGAAAYLLAAVTIVYCAVVDVSTPEAAPQERPLGWAIEDSYRRRGWHKRPTVPDTLPDWLVYEFAVRNVGHWLTGIFAPPRPDPRPLPPEWVQRLDWPEPPPPQQAVATAELPAVTCEVCEGTGCEWRDYWSQDAEPCRNGCPETVPA